MGTHALNSPSSFFRRRLCPGSRRMEENIPDTDNVHSLRGTAVHSVGEMCLKENKTPGYWEGQIVDVIDSAGETVGIKITKEDTAALWTYVDYVSRRKEELNAEISIEERVDPGIWLGRTDVAGNLDCSLLSPDELEIIDYKHGSGKAIEVATSVNGKPQLNDQPALYAIGKLATLDWTKVPVSLPVKLTIVQPRCPHPQSPIRSVTVAAHELFALVDEYKALAHATDDPNAPLIPGDEQCFFCKAKSTCPALGQKAVEVFSPVPEPVDSIHHVIQKPPPISTGWDAIETVLGRPTDQLDLEHKVRALEAEKLVMAWFKAIREDLTEYALKGNKVPDDKLVASVTKRTWDLEDEAIINKLSKLRTSKGETVGKAKATVIKPLSPAQAEKQLQPLVTERTWKGVAKLIIKPEGKPTLVPVTDPREAIKKVEKVILKEEPGIVAIELDKKRLYALLQKDKRKPKKKTY